MSCVASNVCIAQVCRYFFSDIGGTARPWNCCTPASLFGHRLWLGHESVETTQVYLYAQMALKEAALAKLRPINGGAPGRYVPGDHLLEFLSAPQCCRLSRANVSAIGWIDPRSLRTCQ